MWLWLATILQCCININLRNASAGAALHTSNTLFNNIVMIFQVLNAEHLFIKSNLCISCTLKKSLVTFCPTLTTTAISNITLSWTHCSKKPAVIKLKQSWCSKDFGDTLHCPLHLCKIMKQYCPLLLEIWDFIWFNFYYRKRRATRRKKMAWKKKREDAAKVMYAGIKYSLVWLGDFNMANVRHVMLILL